MDGRNEEDGNGKDEDNDGDTSYDLGTSDLGHSSTFKEWFDEDHPEENANGGKEEWVDPDNKCLEGLDELPVRQVGTLDETLSEAMLVRIMPVMPFAGAKEGTKNI
jgi:hypothetical protein